MRFSAFKELTRFEQTFFALPFVVAGACLGLRISFFSLRDFWILPAFFLARISGMAFNQLIDRNIDAQNPRTQSRAIPEGRVSVKQAQKVAWGSLVLFLLVCLQINSLTALLACAAAFLIAIYSYMKRIHFSCHFILGAIHFLGPVMAYGAITGTFSWAPLLLGAASFCLIAANDIIYAIQDYNFDQTNGIHSLPAKFGIDNALVISSILHGLCAFMLTAAGIAARFGLSYFLLIPVVILIFVLFHRKLRARSGIELLFFKCTVAVSFSTLIFVMSSAVWDVLL